MMKRECILDEDGDTNGREDGADGVNVLLYIISWRSRPRLGHDDEMGRAEY